MPTQTRYSDELIQRVNELFHDYTAVDYSRSHPEIFEEEAVRWRRLSKYLNTLDHPIRILDVGSGTGFVAAMISGVMKEKDTIILSDLSLEMLNLAKKKLEGEPKGPHLKFLKIASGNPYRIPLESNSVDGITMNSVLHHIQDTKTFLGELDRVLRPGGLLAICHEPNRRFFDKSLSYWAYRLASLVDTTPTRISRAIRIAALKLSRQVSAERFARRIYYLSDSAREKRRNRITQSSYQSLMLDDINRTLLAEHLISIPLEPDIGKLIDVRATTGFDPLNLVPNYQILHLETYDHLYKFKTVHRRNTLIKLIDDTMSKILPNQGSNFCEVLRKPVIMPIRS